MDVSSRMNQTVKKSWVKQIQHLKKKRVMNSENNMITKKNKISEVLENSENAAEILFKSGLACIGCPMTMQETLEDGCKAHGMSDKEIDDLVGRLNRK